MNARTGDYWAALATLGIAAFLVFGSLELPEGGPEKMPQLLAIILGICGLLLAFRTVRSMEPQPDLFQDVHWPAFWTLIISWSVTVLVLSTVGFYVTLCVFIGGMTWFLLNRPLEPGKIAGTIVFAVLTTAVMWFIFSFMLKMDSPQGWLF